jgi:hypothetical protein
VALAVATPVMLITVVCSIVCSVAATASGAGPLVTAGARSSASKSRNWAAGEARVRPAKAAHASNRDAGDMIGAMICDL